MQFRLLTVAAGVLLAACGGGGGGSAGPVPASVVFNLDAAVTNAFTSGFTSGTLSGSDSSNNNYTAVINYQPAAAATFEGGTYKQVTETVTLTKNGAFAGNSTTNAFFTTGPFTPKGSTHSDGTYTVASQQIALPTAATVGQTGSFDSLTTYTSAAKTSVSSTTVTTWSLEADTASTAFLCANTSSSFSNGARTAESDCYKINAAGQVLGAKATVTINGTTIAFK